VSVSQRIGGGQELEHRIEGMLAPSLEAMGYAIVRVALIGGNRPTLQVMAERLDGVGMTVDHCAEISRATSAILDVEDPLPSAYLLEVSSPGIDRPLTRRADFDRFAGYEARIDATRLIDGRKRFKGLLLGLGDGDTVRLREGTTERHVPLDAIGRAKLVLTEALLAQSLDRPKV